MNWKIIVIPTILIFGLVSILGLTLKEKACFWLDENGESVICYEKLKFQNNENNIKTIFSSLVNTIQKPDGSLERFISYSDELEKGFGGKKGILNEIQKEFSWIEEDNLVYIIEGEEFSVTLLNKGSSDGYALHLNNMKSKFFFTYDKIMQYEPIVIGWVNGGYYGGIHINWQAFWQRYDNSKCLFKKANVLLYTSKLTEIDNGDYICNFGIYQLTKTLNDSVVKSLEMDKSPEARKKIEQVDKPTIRFIKWILD